MDQRRVVIGVALSILFLVLYQEFVLSRYTRKRAPTSVTTAAVPAQEPTEARPEAPAKEIAATTRMAAGRTDDLAPVVIETGLLRARITPHGGRLESLELKKFRSGVAADSGALDLVKPAPILPLTLMTGPTESDADVVYEVKSIPGDVPAPDRSEVLLQGTDPAGNRIEKRVILGADRYDFEVQVSIQGANVPREVGLLVTGLANVGVQSSRQAPDLGIALSEGHLVEKPLAKLPKSPEEEIVGNAEWAGFASQYFLGVVIPRGPGRTEMFMVGDLPVARVSSETTAGRVGFSVFVGPKSREVLNQAGHQLGRALDFGWFWFIAVPLLTALRLIDGVTGNYGVAIIVLTALVKLATVPLTRSTFKNMAEMRKLQPQMETLRKRHKDDQMALQKETMELYKRHGVSPLSGCLPMLLQLPIFVGLYNALSHAIELRHAPFFLWITDLSAPESLPVAGFAIPVLTLLMGASMLVQQWISPQQGDPAQQKMMMVMPVVFTYMFMGFPSGLVLYWLVNNVLTIGQQYFMMRTQS